MESKWLEDFISLAETRSFSRSAEQRHVTHLRGEPAQAAHGGDRVRPDAGAACFANDGRGERICPPE